MDPRPKLSPEVVRIYCRGELVYAIQLSDGRFYCSFCLKPVMVVV